MRLPPDQLAMGTGDPMIFAGIGACLGWQAMPMTLFLASVIGSVIGIVLRVTGQLKDRGPISDEDPWIPPDSAVPFGPFLALGGVFAAFFATRSTRGSCPCWALVTAASCCGTSNKWPDCGSDVFSVI